MAYNFKEVEKKWQNKWEKEGTFECKIDHSKKKWYGLIEFPYPSGQGLHVGHPRSYTALDIIARKKRMEGLNVLYPIGFDAFGLPAENYAIKNHVHPKITTEKNVAHFTEQLKSLGFSFDWSREVNTTDPKYYRWTQWIFLQLYKKGLAYKATMPINFCTGCKVGLANEEVVNGVCERCGSPVVQKEKSQWMLKITEYAQRLIDDLDDVDYLEKIKAQQKNWIGRSEGAEVNFRVAVQNDIVLDENGKVKVVNGEENKLLIYTTRPDTIFGATYMVVAPEHNIIKKYADKITNLDEVESYKQKAALKSDFERSELNKEKSGVEIKGIKAINPLTNEAIPIWISDYVLITYGTGAIMAVPAHDDRDFEFATKFNLPIIQVVEPVTIGVNDATPRENVKDEFRNNVLAIVKHWSENKYLCLDWNTANWHSFVIGGIEEKESAKEAAIREVKEETGYVSVKLANHLRMKTFNKSYAPHKNVNRCAEFDIVYIELQDDKQIATNNEDTKNHKYVWIDESEIQQFINLQNNLDAFEQLQKGDKAFTDVKSGRMINSGILNGLEVEDAKKKIIKYIEENKLGTRKVNYKLRDWVFSRQRYWGEPIPMVYCEDCGWVPVKEEDLPLTLPEVEDYEPGENGESPLSKLDSWINTTCPHCGKKAKRETDTMPQWAGSSWYFLRYMDPNNENELASKEALEYWGPVDWYNGGMEHTTLHLLYSRFWHKFLYDIGVVPTKEPYAKRTSHGMILGSNGEKMSKSKGNVVNPDDIVRDFGADTLRVYEMFLGPFDQTAPWSMDSVRGCSKFLDRVWNLQDILVEGEEYSPKFENMMHKAIKKVTNDIEEMKFNTSIATFMTMVNEFVKAKEINKAEYKTFLQLLNPFAPHITEELFERIGENKTINETPWPKYDEAKTIDEEIEVPVQVNGKLKGLVKVSKDAEESLVKEEAHKIEAVLNAIENKNIVKEIYVKGKIFNIVVK
jgi:leucyl-tRNA synthetase